MELIEILKIVVLGLIEGITEWLPVSSTGHLILFNKFWPLKDVSPSFADMFEYVVQLAAILAVVVLFWKKLFPLGKEKMEEKNKLVWKKDVLTMWLKVIVACVPALLALVVDKLFEDLSSTTTTVIIAAALIFYGVVFILIETFYKKDAKVKEISQLSYKYAFFIGCFQVLASIPGTSRSGVTILAALLLGISRPAGAEFTFFLAIPVMVGASLLQFLKNVSGVLSFTVFEWIYLFAGFAVAFAVSMLCIKWLMSFVRNHDFKPFGWYRIALGALVLATMVIPAWF